MAGSADARAWDHTSFAVNDIDKAIKFYRDVFGYEITWEDRGWRELIARYIGAPDAVADLVQMRSPLSEHTLEFIEFRDITSGYEASGPTRPGEAHICFEIDDIEASIKACEEAGAVMVGEVVPYPVGGRGCYMRDPSGIVFELDEAPMNK